MTPRPKAGWSLASYEFSIIRTVWKLFGKRKALEFIIYLPSVLVERENRAAYEKIAPCETTVQEETMYLPHPDAGFVKEIVLDGCYTGVPGFQIGPDDTVVDLGANIGIFTIMAGMRARNGRVIALEPEARNYGFLCDNVRANHLSNVVPLRMAVSDHDGFARLHLAPSGSSTIVSSFAKSEASQIVESVSLATLFPRSGLDKIDFLKMDVEGAEFEAFADDRWLERVSKISMEVHPRAGDVRLLRDKLVRRNFDFRLTAGRDQLTYLYAKRSGS